MRLISSATVQCKSGWQPRLFHARRLAYFTRLVALVFIVLAYGQTAWAKDPAVDVEAQRYWGMLDNYCIKCHNFDDYRGGLAMEALTPDTVVDEAETWEKAVRKLRGSLMPPPGSARPRQSDIDGFITWLESHLDQPLLNDPSHVTVGHVPVHRLNRDEYTQAVKDLLAVDIDAGDYLPPEIEVDGFKNIASALTVSPSFLDQQVALARAAAHLAVGEPEPKFASVYYPVPAGFALQGQYQPGLPLGSRGGVKFEHTFPADGEYRFNILDLDIGLYPRAAETRHTVVLLVGRKEVYRGEVGGEEDIRTLDREGPAGMKKVIEQFQNIPAQVTAGTHDVVVTFVERSWAESDSTVDFRGSFDFSGFNAVRLPRVIDGIEIQGPYNPTGLSMSPSRQKIFVCYPHSAKQESTCAAKIIQHLARRAFRRPVTDDEVNSLLAFYQEGRRVGNFDVGIEYMVTAVLASPDFLYRGIDTRNKTEHDNRYALNDLEIATRLAFFLWSEGPDDELLSLAAANKLTEPKQLKAQIQRMLKDPRADALIEHFAINWLNLDDLAAVEPEPAQFPGFSDALRNDFSKEIHLFLSSILLGDRPVNELLTAKHTFLNQRLAYHYGVEGVFGPQFRRVELKDPNRWGLLGKSAVLLRTSYGDRTSPVLRGAWVLEKLMGTPPTPPPANVNTDLSVPKGQKPTTVRARLEKHREDTVCKQCHGVIDPIGLALENFDVIGRWRDRDALADAPIDASTVLPSGKAVEGPIELRQALVSRKDQFVLAMTEKLFMYSLGRELEYYDMPQVRKVVHDAAKDDYRLSALVFGIVNSVAFRNQSLPGRDVENQMTALP